MHGFGANNKSNWFPWLETKLQTKKITTDFDNFPNSDNPKLTEWIKFLLPKINNNSILVGHSLGCPTILKTLEQYEGNVKGVFLVSGFAQNLNLPFSQKIDNFTESGFDFKKINKKTKKFILFDSKDDPLVLPREGDFLEKNIKITKRITFEDRGHLNLWNKEGSFSELLNEIV